MEIQATIDGAIYVKRTIHKTAATNAYRHTNSILRSKALRAINETASIKQLFGSNSGEST